MGQLPHYCEAFSVQSQRCFRLVLAEDGTGHAQHCPHEPEWRGQFKDAAGKWHTVEACEGHRADRRKADCRARSTPLRIALEPLKRAKWTTRSCPLAKQN